MGNNLKYLTEQTLEVKISYVNAISYFLRFNLNEKKTVDLEILINLLNLNAMKEDLLEYLQEPDGDEIDEIFETINEYGITYIAHLFYLLDKNSFSKNEKQFLEFVIDKFRFSKDVIELISHFITATVAHKQSQIIELSKEILKDKKITSGLDIFEKDFANICDRIIFTDIQNDINVQNLEEEVTKKKLFESSLGLKNQKMNIMITGATGCGKSSTINAIFDKEIAKVGIEVESKTIIQKYELENLILWDSPGLGDGKEKDIQHSKAIIKKLNELDKDGNPLIDLVLVILDGGSRDLEASYELINQVIIPNLGENAEGRILIAINQADIAMKGRYWDYKNNKPEPQLVDFLEEKVTSIKNRIKEATDIDVEPIYYSAGYKDGDDKQRPWNLSKLLDFIIVRMFYTGKIDSRMLNVTASIVGVTIAINSEIKKISSVFGW